MSEKTHELLGQILTAQVLTMQSLITIEERLCGRPEGEGEQPSLSPEPQPEGKGERG